jgi:hypothetical protein
MSVTGGDRWRRDLGRLRKAFNPNTLERIATDGALVIRDKAQVLAPRRLGVLAGGIIVVTASKAQRKVVTGLTYSRDAFYGRSQELGTGPRYTDTGAFRGILPANPHMRPAFDSERERAIDAMGRRADSVIKRALR